ncbi:MAG TPA: two-component regulator propeller domain-containing protein, partial [Paludibacter sp.]|nr:two-component regulator propeller domain-containing protein [Paludibacter sp.]
MKTSRLFLLAAILFIINALHAIPYKVTYITSENGLSRNLVNHIFRDSRGFMWFSTGKGLDRFDGYDFIHFNSSGHQNHLLGDAVNCVEEDNNGDLWIGTESGLYFRDYETGEIISATLKLNLSQKYLSQFVRSIHKDENGNLWIVNTSGIYKIEFGTNNSLSV